VHKCQRNQDASPATFFRLAVATSQEQYQCEPAARLYRRQRGVRSPAAFTGGKMKSRLTVVVLSAMAVALLTGCHSIMPPPALAHALVTIETPEFTDYALTKANALCVAQQQNGVYLSTDAVKDTRLIRITCTGASRAEAARVCNRIARTLAADAQSKVKIVELAEEAPNGMK
jgi:hypothetical protein